ncbi:HAD superfamily hydrolase (TIGR01509 family) [Paenibacillus castaneae]|uniref:HAD family hydrolase n=1 Tax=Paenibacillus castaneae TaxID=474957 RepID=UPI000C9D248B|nr:HAD-IA family hydrolase [Paenibacillus castaneae]NIK80602.1 HAD superfamily hydrolase (TIGR01509 family) [Paenibacillus castaneae]
MIKAIIFDFDGLIFDTETPEFRAFQEIYEEHGLKLEIEKWGQWVGTDSSKFNPYDYLDECVGKPLNREEIRTLRRLKFGNLIVKEKIRPGVEEYLIAAKDLGLKVGLASSSTKDWVNEHLMRLNVVEYFDCIRVRDDVKKVKPDPELYLQVLNYFGIEPKEAIAFEDSPNGARAAKHAGMHCIVIPNDITKELKFDEVDVDLRLISMEQKSLKSLIEQFN